VYDVLELQNALDALADWAQCHKRGKLATSHR